MKTGTELTTLAQRILTQAKSRRDYAMDTRKLTMLPDARLAFEVNGQLTTTSPTEHCLGQIVDRVGIPRRYAERLQTQAPSLLATNVNHWFENSPEIRMVRTLDGDPPVARAFLSHRYRPLDNGDLIEHIVPQLTRAGCEIRSCETTERHLYIQAVTPRVTGEVQKGDIVQAGVTVSNSEVGAGSLRVEPLIFRLVCLNGLILPTAMRRHHVGRAGEGQWEEGQANEVFSDETRQQDDKAFWLKVRDVVNDVVTPLRFADHIKRLTQASQVDTGKPTEAVEVLTDRYHFSDQESESVLEHLSRGGDLSLWGLANAVTRTANDLESYDRAVQFERIGGEVIALPKSLFNN